ncbi:cysteine and histidine-rich protein 1 [Lingula anatina]|uniref:Cysteine and histidine-rich protein 1 n=1 Tax=Lingula anatina TaxID=7574 RepID=A0A1S3JK55_LINAN|nr:cysteine and histidine-rich protein 1 [Lingula anatina]|eukprot:XP_013410757.1 cysteine and histidine-rich protein 1 [Lingula anatina]
MAEVAGPSLEVRDENQAIADEDRENIEPEKKKAKTEKGGKHLPYNLEERLNGILCCTVCLDLPRSAVYQCINGHLMCAGCFSHLLADARLKDETATCPNCRCEISKTHCSRNLAVEKAVCELPSECQYCAKQLPRCKLEQHESELCIERITACKYLRIGCPWKGPFHELFLHEQSCLHPKKSGDEIMEALKQIDESRARETMLFDSIFNLLSFEKITFSDLQLRPYRTDDFITKLFYETSRFTAFNLQWVIKARVNDDIKNPHQTMRRMLSYQLVLKSKIQAPIDMYFIALQGPYGETKVRPIIYRHEFSDDSPETDYHILPVINSMECNKMLAAKTVNVRLILFQVQK